MQVYSALSGVKLCQWVKIDLNQNAEQSKHYRGKPSCMYSLDLRNFWEDFPRNTAIFPASPWCFARFCFSINYIHDGNRPAEFHSLWHRIQRVVMITRDNIQNACIVFHPKLYSQLTRVNFSFHSYTNWYFYWGKGSNHLKKKNYF